MRENNNNTLSAQLIQNEFVPLPRVAGSTCEEIDSITRQIRFRVTATLRQPQIKQSTALNEGGCTKPTGTSYNFDKVWSGAPNGRFGKLYIIKDANNFDKSVIQP